MTKPNDAANSQVDAAAMERAAAEETRERVQMISEVTREVMSQAGARRDFQAEYESGLIMEEGERAVRSREGYIAWRMMDLPTVYHALVPYSCNAKELWDAERAVRAQYAEDLKYSASPWRRIGEPCHLLDLSDLSAEERMTFGLEVSVPAGQRDIAKRGREDEVRAIIDAERSAARAN